MPIHGYPGGVITANPVAPTASVATGVWTTEQQLQAVSQGNWPGYEYPISRSLRFNSADSAYLNRTPASASNRRTWTWSGWVKRSAIGSGDYTLFSCCPGGTDNSNYFNLLFNNNTIRVESFTVWRITTPLYRDPSAWYHVVATIDTTNATAGNRVKLYVNGVEVTTFSTNNNPTLNEDLSVNRADAHQIGRRGNTFSGLHFDGYLTEVNFIDGQALEPSSFGLNDPETGVWSPKRYTGTYGTNGFYLNFSDNSNTTSTTLGKDSSGNGNNWTPNNFSVTAGAGNDSLVDVPTNYGTDTGIGGEVRGNYATLNPLNKGTSQSITNGNLDIASTSTIDNNTSSTIGMSSGKWYFEVTITNLGSGEYAIGLGKNLSPNTVAGNNATSWAYADNGNLRTNGSNSAYGASYTTNDILSAAFDADAGTLVFYKNGVSQGTAATGITNGPYFFLAGTYLSGSSRAVNFGQRAFAYTAPSGFKALCTQNLPTPTIGATSTTQANDYFNAVLYTGTGSSLGVTGVGFQPDWTWIKGRSGATDHGLYDAVRGVQKQLESNTTTAETTETTGLTAFNSDGFTVGALAQLNTSSATYVAWNWKANGAGSSNTAGTITSTVSANTTSGFSIVTYTGTGANATVGHGLGVAPSMIIVKNRTDGTRDWLVYHDSIGNTAAVFLNLTNASTALSAYWNNTSPTSSVFSLGNSSAGNGSTNSLVAYCFAPVAGYSAFGSYTGNGSADGPFVYTGFRPRYLLLKVSSTTSSWFVYDSARDTYNIVSYSLNPNLSDAEGNTGVLDFVSNGFKLRNSGASFNVNGNTVIYAAFAESPFKYALAR